MLNYEVSTPNRRLPDSQYRNPGSIYYHDAMKPLGASWKVSESRVQVSTCHRWASGLLGFVPAQQTVEESILSHLLHVVRNMSSSPASTPQLPFKTSQIPSNRIETTRPSMEVHWRALVMECERVGTQMIPEMPECRAWDGPSSRCSNKQS